MHVSVVIRALNEAEHLPRLLEGLASQTRIPDEVLLVDSGSTDRSVEIAEKYGARVVHIPPGDFTFGRALNLGCESAKGDLLVFASAHVYPVSDEWIAELVAPFEVAKVGLVYGRQTGDERTSFSEMRLFRDWFPAQDDLDQDHPFCNNANAAVRRSWWERIPYDEELPGLEDIAWATEMRRQGGQVAYSSQAAIVHVHEESSRQTLNRYRREAIAHRSFSGASPMLLGRAMQLASRHMFADAQAAVSERQFSALPSIVGFRAAQFAGAWLAGREDASDTDKVIRRMYYPSR